MMALTSYLPAKRVAGSIRTQFFRLFRTIASKAGLAAEKQHPHVLKHSIASHLVSANVNLALVITLIYMLPSRREHRFYYWAF
jgi:site-specific recombinase XerD